MSDTPVHIDFVGRDETSAVIRQVKGELTGLEALLARNQIAAAKFGIDGSRRIAELREEISKTRSQLIGFQTEIGQAFSKIPSSSVPQSTLDAVAKTLQGLQQAPALYNNVAIAASRWLEKQKQSAEVEFDSAKRIATANRTADLERKAAIAAEIDNFKKLQAARQEAQAERDIQKGIQEADKEITARNRIVSAERRYDLERRAQIAQEIQAYSRLQAAKKEVEESGSKASNAAKGIAGISDEARLAQRELRHVVALFDEFSRNQRGQMTATFGSMLRDAGLGGTGIAIGFAGLAAASAVTHFVEWNRELAKLAEKQTTFAASIGMSTQDYIAFSGALRLTGGDAESASRALESLQKRMLEAVQNPNSNAMDAFSQIGISWDDLKKRMQDPQGLLRTLFDMADAFKNMGSEAQRAAIFTRIFDPRQLQELVPIFSRGAAGMKELIDQSRATTPAFQQNIDKLRELQEKINLLDETWLNFKASVVGSGGMFEGSIEGVTKLLGELSGLKAFDWGRLSPLVQLARMGGYLKDPINAPDMSRIIRRATPQELEDRNRTDSFRVGGALGNRSGEMARLTARNNWLEYPVNAGNALDNGPAERLRQKIIASGELGGRGRPNFDYSSESSLRTGLTSPTANLPVETKATASGLPTDFGVEAAEKLYLARLHYAQASAEALHQDQARQNLLQKEAEYLAKNPDDRRKELEATTAVGKADADIQTQQVMIATRNLQLNKSLTEERLKSTSALIQHGQIEAAGRENLAEVLAKEKERAALITADQFKSPAEKQEALNRVLQAEINLRKQNFQLMQSEFAESTRVGGAGFKRFEELMKIQVDQRKITPIQAAGFNVQELVKIYQTEAAILDKIKEQTVAEGNKIAQLAVERQQRELVAQTEEKITEQYRKAADAIKQENEKMLQPLRSMFSSIGSAFESFLDAGISKSKTLGAALRDMLISIGKDIAKTAFDIGGRVLSRSLGGMAGEGISDMLARQVGGLFGLTTKIPETAATSLALSTAMTTGGATAGAEIATAMTTAGTAVAGEIATAMAAGGATSAASGAASAAGSAGGLFSGVKALFSFLPFFSGGGIIPSAAGGMLVGSNGKLGVFHPREMVLPANISDGLQNLISNGGAAGGGGPTGGGPQTVFNYNANVTGYHPFATRSSFESMLRTHGGSMQAWAENMMRNRAFA